MTKATRNKTIVKFTLDEQELKEAICMLIEDKGELAPVDCVESIEVVDSNAFIIFGYESEDNK